MDIYCEAQKREHRAVAPSKLINRNKWIKSDWYVKYGEAYERERWGNLKEKPKWCRRRWKFIADERHRRCDP